MEKVKKVVDFIVFQIPTLIGMAAVGILGWPFFVTLVIAEWTGRDETHEGQQVAELVGILFSGLFWFGVIFLIKWLRGE